MAADMIMTITTNLAIRCRSPATTKYPPQKHHELSKVVLYALSMLNSLIRDHARDNHTHAKSRRYRTMPMLSRPWTEHPRRSHSRTATNMLSKKKNRVRSIGNHPSSGTPLNVPANTKSKNNASKLTKPPRIETSRSNSVSDMAPRPGTGPVPPARSIALGAAICLIDRQSPVLGVRMAASQGQRIGGDGAQAGKSIRCPQPERLSFRDLRHDGIVQPLLLASGQEVVVPEQAEAPVEPSANVRQTGDPVVRLLRCQAEILPVEQRHLHHGQRSFSERQQAALLEVVDRKLIACAAAKAGLVGMCQGGVVGQSDLRVAAPGLGHGEAQVVLPAAPCRLADTEVIGGLEQRGELRVQARPVAIGVIARMQAELVSTVVNLTENVGDRWRIETILLIDP